MTSAEVLTGFITYDQPAVQGTHFVTPRLRGWCPATGLGSPHQVSPKGTRGAPMAIDKLTSIPALVPGLSEWMTQGFVGGTRTAGVRRVVI